jgi:hypothetical protein
LLPHLEQTAVYDHWDQDVEWGPGYARNKELYGFEIDVLQCPSDIDNEPWFNADHYTGPRREAFSSYRCNQGTRIQLRYWSPRDGIFYPQSTIRFADITDGLSTTFGLSEYYNAQTRLPNDEDTHWYGIWCDPGADLFTTQYPMNADFDNALSWPAAPVVDGASSGHEGGAHFGMMDGSVRFISESIESWRLTQANLDEIWNTGSTSVEPRLYQWLSTRNGGEVVDEF